MEADLPTEQLSEMFNINHFIISQANPHAVMFSPRGLVKATVWSNPIIAAYINILKFVKNQVKAWARNIVELTIGQRAAPLWDTRRSFVSQFFTQEYEGRDCDVTFNPWEGHKSLFSAFLHLIYNPPQEEFFEWIRAAERQTWQNIPEIKSHIAEEITLDQCVQRLRKRLAKESWEKKRRNLRHNNSTLSETTDEKMGKRVPSFFTSPSLVKMSGLGVGDQHIINMDTNIDPTRIDNGANHQNMENAASSTEKINLGWGGMGLSGNKSFNSLNGNESVGSGLFIENSSFRERSNSQASGLFVDASDDEASASGDIGNLPMSYASVWDVGINRKGPDDSHAMVTNAGDVGYIKTSNMAQFYYGRNKSASQNNLRNSFPSGSLHQNGNASNHEKGWKSSLDLSEHNRKRMM